MATTVINNKPEDNNTILDIIPSLLNVDASNPIMSRINKIIEIVVLVASILIINYYAHDKMMDQTTVEGALSITFFALILFCIIGLIAPALSNYSAINIIDGLLYYTIIPIISFAIWIIQSSYDTLKDVINNIISIPVADLMKYVLLYAFIIVTSIVLYSASFDSTTQTEKSYIYIFCIAIPLIAIIGYIYQLSSEQSNPLYRVGIISVIMTLFLTIFYNYTSSNLATFTLLSYVINFILVIAILVGLALFFYVFSNYLKTIDGPLGFAIYFIFYIPCLLIDFFRYIKREFALTSNVVYILFVVEIILALLYTYVPKLIDYIAYSDGIMLLQDSVFLDIPKVIGNSQQFIMPPLNDLDNQQVIYRKNYALSMWIYLNTESSNNTSYAKETNIFDYGNGKPKITYYNNLVDGRKTDKYIIYFTNRKTDSATYEITLPSQKWNNFVFNYKNNSVDLFINGNLERTFMFDNNFPNYNSTDLFTIGDKNGLNGAIGNIGYYVKPLTSFQIVDTYNLLMDKNPPRNNIL